MTAIGMSGCALLGPRLPQVPADTYPEVTLANAARKVRVMLPDPAKGYYRSVRFDWSGMIARAEYKGHTFFGEWKEPHDPTGLDHGTGPAEEFNSTGFGFPGPLGYNAAKPGGTFMKIGVGELIKPTAEQYLFYSKYALKNPGKWTVRHGPDWIEFRHELAVGDWAYEYTKRVSLAPGQPVIVVERTLRNTGKLPIVSSHYGHNFLRIDDSPAGPDYVVRFPYAPVVQNTLNAYAAVVGHDLYFVREMAGAAVIPTPLGGHEQTPAHNWVQVDNTRTGASVRITGMAPVKVWYFFAVRNAVCPEAYIGLDVAPGQEARWQTTYELIVP